MPITINIESVPFDVQGYSAEVDVTRLHADARDAVFEYGLRRWVQDRTNSAAKAKRDEGETFSPADAEAFVKRLVADLEEGKVSQRGAGMSDVEKVMHQLARTDWLASITDKAKKKAASKLLMGEIREHMAKIVATDPDGYRERAEAEIARRREAAEEKAKNARKAASAIEKAGIDLDELLG